MNDFTESRNNFILSRYLVTSLVLDFNDPKASSSEVMEHMKREHHLWLLGYIQLQTDKYNRHYYI